MGFYSDIILPRLCDLAMGNKQFVPYRERVIGAAEGRVLEIGVGSGMNLPFNRPPVREVLALEPAPRLVTMAPSASHASGAPSGVPLKPVIGRHNGWNGVGLEISYAVGGVTTLGHTACGFCGTRG